MLHACGSYSINTGCVTDLLDQVINAAFVIKLYGSIRVVFETLQDRRFRKFIKHRFYFILWKIDCNIYVSYNYSSVTFQFCDLLFEL